MEDDLFPKIQKAIVELDEENLAQLTEQVTRQGIDTVEAIEETYTVGIHKVGDLFAAGEFFARTCFAASQCVVLIHYQGHYKE